MRKVEVFEANDGFLTKDKEEANKRDKDFRIKSFANEFADKYCYYDMSKSDIADVIVENIEELMKGFKKAMAGSPSWSRVPVLHTGFRRFESYTGYFKRGVA